MRAAKENIISGNKQTREAKELTRQMEDFMKPIYKLQKEVEIIPRLFAKISELEEAHRYEKSKTDETISQLVDRCK